MTAPPPENRRPRILPRTRVPARDGVGLATDVYLPAVEERRPTVVARTPYGRSRPFHMHLARQLSELGLCFVAQDCRGRYASEGKYDLNLEERDTYDTLEWVGRQPWSDGRVALLGISVSTFSNLRAAANPLPPGIEIAALVNLMGVVDAHSLFYRGGALVLHWALPWVTLMSPAHAGRSGWMELPWREIFERRPLARLAADTAGEEELWKNVVSRSLRDWAWEEVSALPGLARIDVPTLSLGGWHDFLLGHTLEGFAGLDKEGRDPRHRLVIGPWNHQNLFYSFRGAQEGEKAHLDLLRLVGGWLRGRLLGGPEQPAAEPRILLSLLGADCWIGAESFPPSGSIDTSFYLGSDGAANSARGDGRLNGAAPARAGRDHFSYDPENPVPTCGGSLWPFSPLGLEAGPADQSAIEERNDVLVYTGEPLEEELVVVGKIGVELWVASSARDTDFTAKLVDLDPLGRAMIVQDGITRARYREGADREMLLEPQRPCLVRIDLDATAYRFAAGHRLRLEVSSSNFPRYDNHPNSSGPLHTAQATTVAQQTVFHGGNTPSRLVLSTMGPEEVARRVWRPEGGARGGDAS